ncbi:MAG: GntR family transcriptional regulator [Pseudomonadales bacterium]|uniref:Transcriptional regulator, GntR family protein n=1 Tax=Oleiphilus messinensis TaxID=141451 RepID=A0A1Y0IIL0_9GAMM|nr:GntR family transcriptional regulator [Oleiphilus messinensis]ARU59273.1 transcriptional regulator, GntR family protein [Oleiphilus messinensis]MCG8609700.1 GntR family transcriptional regulator [Pseudomonadales bacterium]
MIPNATSRTRSDEVFEQLQNAIVEGKFAAGQRVSESELATMFGVSRAPLRDAVRRLEGRGLLIKKPHVGITVVSLGIDELLQIYFVREALEGMACRLAAQHMPQADIDNLRLLLEQHAREINASEGQVYYQEEGNLDFHYRIAQGAGNQKLMNLLFGDLYHLIRMYRCRFSTSEGRPQKALKEHTQILDAIENRDPELAEMLMRRHIASARTNIEKRFQEI